MVSNYWVWCVCHLGRNTCVWYRCWRSLWSISTNYVIRDIMKNVPFISYLILFSPAILLGIVVFCWKSAYKLGRAAARIVLKHV